MIEDDGAAVGISHLHIALAPQPYLSLCISPRFCFICVFLFLLSFYLSPFLCVCLSLSPSLSLYPFSLSLSTIGAENITYIKKIGGNLFDATRCTTLHHLNCQELI